MSDLVKSGLCHYDPEYKYYVSPEDMGMDKEDAMRVRDKDCACDNCYNGKDKYALKIDKLEAKLKESEVENRDLKNKWDNVKTLVETVSPEVYKRMCQLEKSE